MDIQYPYQCSLVTPSMKKRMENGGLTRALRSTIESFLTENDKETPEEADSHGDLLHDDEGSDNGDSIMMEPDNVQVAKVRQPLYGKRRRCESCVSELSVVNHREEKNKMGKQKTQCQICCKAICKSHAIMTCKSSSGTVAVDDIPGPNLEDDFVFE